MISRLLITILVAGLTNVAATYALGPYSIDRLHRESDIVVICSIRSSSIVTNDSGYGPEIYEMFLTRIRPIVFIKGKATEPDLVVRHFGVKHDHGKGTAGKPPRFFRFIGQTETESETAYLTGTEHVYMLFLKRDGTEYVPTSGQRDARDSIVPLRLTRNQAWIQTGSGSDG